MKGKTKADEAIFRMMMMAALVLTVCGCAGRGRVVVAGVGESSVRAQDHARDQAQAEQARAGGTVVAADEQRGEAGVEAVVEAEGGEVEVGPPKDEAKPAGPLAEGKLFDGKTLGHWRATDFAGRGEVTVKDGMIVIGMGHDMSGITWDGQVIRMNYEIQLEAMRVDGTDFFCGLTFPVGKDPCSFIVGGWGGSLVGISSLDGFDAANNETTRFMGFKKGQWYRIKVSVTPGKIQAWIDDKKMVDVETEGRRIGIRWEVEKSVPLGIATWQTTGAVRNIYVWRK